MFRTMVLLSCLSVAALNVDAAVPPLTYSGASLGRDYLLGDFPSNLSSYGWYATPYGHGYDGYSDSLSTVHFVGLTAITSAVDYAELKVGVHSFTTSPAIPSFRVYARKAVSPADPSTGLSERPSQYYNGGSGWTTGYIEFRPVIGDTGTHRIDVTSLVNELAAQSGGTGTSITLIFEPVDIPPGDGSYLRFQSSAALALKIYPSLNDREYQKVAIAGGSTIFYMPLDSADLGANGASISSFRTVVPAGGVAGAAGSDQFSNTEETLLVGVARTSDYSMEITQAYPELVAEGARKLVAPEQSTYSEFIGSSFYWPVKTSNRSYMLLVQFVQNGVEDDNWFLWDFYGTWAFQMSFNELGGFKFSNTGDPPAIPFPGSYRNVLGEVKTICVYYDAVVDKVYGCYQNGQAGTPIAWTSGDFVGGSANVMPVSGNSFPFGTKIQGIAAFEWTTTRRLSEVKFAVERARALWSTGVKALPPMLN